MAIPLIQNVEKQDINTSIIAIRRQLEQLYNALGVTENTVSSDDISKSTGTPLGTWASFVNDYAPNGEWLESGSTFNENTYPALAMMLGGNVVPIMYDHNRPSDYEALTLTTTNQEMQYDGVINITLAMSNNNRYVYVNDVAISRQDTNSGTIYVPHTITVKKGDMVRTTVAPAQTYVRYYKHPLFIKATPTSADSDYEGTLNAIREFYVRNNTYSTEERLTGGVWIDGKPIYRRVSTATGSSSGWGNILVNDFNAQTILKCLVIESGNFTSVPSYVTTNQSGYIRCFFPSGGTSVGATVVLEYTKTSD